MKAVKNKEVNKCFCEEEKLLKEIVECFRHKNPEDFHPPEIS